MSTNTFGERLREKREQAKLKASELAFNCGWDGPQRISNYESGTRFPGAEDFSTICRELDRLNEESTAHYVMRGEVLKLDRYSSKSKGSILEAFRMAVADSVHLGIVQVRPKMSENDLLQVFIKHLSAVELD